MRSPSPPRPPRRRARKDLVAAEFKLGDNEYAFVSFDLIPSALLSSLSAAEREVVVAALAGRSYAQIARERGCSRNTVANQLSAAYRKLGVSSRAELAARLGDDE